MSAATMEIRMEVSHKTKKKMVHYSTPWCIPKRISLLQTYLPTVLMMALFIIVKLWNQPVCLPMNGSRKCVYIHSRILFIHKEE
jgi:hypothetical protein